MAEYNRVREDALSWAQKVHNTYNTEAVLETAGKIYEFLCGDMPGEGSDKRLGASITSDDVKAGKISDVKLPEYKAQVGKVSVDVVPDISGFEKKLAAQIEAALKKVESHFGPAGHMNCDCAPEPVGVDVADWQSGQQKRLRDRDPRRMSIEEIGELQKHAREQARHLRVLLSLREKDLSEIRRLKHLAESFQAAGRDAIKGVILEIERRARNTRRLSQMSLLMGEADRLRHKYEVTD